MFNIDNMRKFEADEPTIILIGWLILIVYGKYCIKMR